MNIFDEMDAIKIKFDNVIAELKSHTTEIANNEINLCASCCKEVPDCGTHNIIFGDGKDNVAACSTYEPIELRHPKHNGAGQI